MCRTATNESACVGCKSPCIDIDAEQAYWENLEKPARQFVQYGYVGILIAFFLYFYLFAGNWDYYFSGAWSRDDAIGTLLSPGFYLLGQAIPLPKLIAVPLTLAIFTVLSYLILSRIEKIYRGYLRQQRIPQSRQRSHHILFTLTTVFSFWFFFCFGGRPMLNTLPSLVGLGFNAIVTISGSLWIYRTWGRTQSQYENFPESIVPPNRHNLERADDNTESVRQHLEKQMELVDGDRLQFKPKSTDGNTTLVKSGNQNRSDTTETRRK